MKKLLTTFTSQRNKKVMTSKKKIERGDKQEQNLMKYKEYEEALTVFLKQGGP